MCVITIENIAAEAVIGVEEHERMRPTPVTATVTVSYDSSAAEKEDDIARAVDYALLSQTVRETVAGSRCRLLETLAGRIGAGCWKRWRGGLATAFFNGLRKPKRQPCAFASPEFCRKRRPFGLKSAAADPPDKAAVLNRNLWR